MNRILLLILIAGLTFLVVLFLARPDLLENVWMWLIGFAGLIAKFFQTIVDFFKNLVTGDKKDDDKVQDDKDSSAELQLKQAASLPPFKGTTLTLLRYSDDGTTTIGILLVNDRFYCYTLEDAFREEKVKGETRIAAGIYPVRFRQEDTELTLKYKERYPEWFTYHLQLQNVPEFDSIYIHNGGDHTDTEGCILVSDSLSINNEKTILSNSRNTFKRLYNFLRLKLDEDIPVRMVIRDEKWVKDLN